MADRVRLQVRDPTYPNEERWVDVGDPSVGFEELPFSGTIDSGNITIDSGNISIDDGTIQIVNADGDEVDIEQIVDSTTNLDGKEGIVTASVLFGRVSDSLFLPLKVDPSTQSLQIIDYEHHEIHSGSHYFVSGYQDLAQNNVLDFTWLMPNTTKWIHWTFEIDVEDETQWSVYEGAVATNPLANAITPLNSNRNSANTSATTMKYEVQANLAAANADTAVGAATLLMSGLAGSKTSSTAVGAASRGQELIMKQNTLYCLRAIAGAAGYINFKLEWYEHTDAN
jgi:hypothetical protein